MSHGRYGPRFFDALATCIEGDALDLAFTALLDELRNTPRWRLVKRFHLERQIRVIRLCNLAYRKGVDSDSAYRS
jgi:hypothetical protein